MTPDERDRLVRLESSLKQMLRDLDRVGRHVDDIKAVTDKMKSEQLYVRAGLAVIVVLAGAVTWVINTASSVAGFVR